MKMPGTFLKKYRALLYSKLVLLFAEMNLENLYEEEIKHVFASWSF